MGKLQPKKFQTDTIEHVFTKLSQSHSRFLVADEVGLGKTIVARGVIQKFQQSFKKNAPSSSQEKQLVLYVCSSSDIGKQNAKKLMSDGGESLGEGRASRLTMLFHDEAQQAVRIEKELERVNKGERNVILSKTKEKSSLEVICLTPATSFDFGFSEGKKEERIFLHALLCKVFEKNINGEKLLKKNGTLFFTSPAKSPHQEWKNAVQSKMKSEVKSVLLKRTTLIEQLLALLDTPFLDSQIHLGNDVDSRFYNSLKISKKTSLIEVFWTILDMTPDLLEKKSERAELFRRLRRVVIKKLRERLAIVVVKTLQPQLVVLDEFQNFSEMLSTKSSENKKSSQIVETLFNKKTRLLLLSATPYKAATADFESAEHSHYVKFWATLDFLFQFDPKGKERLNKLEADFNSYREALQCLSSKGDKSYYEAQSLKRKIQSTLREVMVRSERFRYIDDPSSGVIEPEEVTPWIETAKASSGSFQEPLKGVEFQINDVHYLAWLKEAFKADQQMFLPEIWNSIPYALNLMPKGYKMISSLYTSGEGLDGHLKKAINNKNADIFCPRLKDLRVNELDKIAPNPKLRELIHQIKSEEMFRHLWIPPTKPYYSVSDVSSNIKPRKRLIFSRWQAVPQAVSILASQFVEYQLDAQGDDHGDKLKLTYDKNELASLLFHPSAWLANCGASIYARNTCGNLSLEQISSTIRKKIEEDLLKKNISIVEGKLDSIDSFVSLFQIMEPRCYVDLYKSTLSSGRRIAPRSKRTDEEHPDDSTSSILNALEKFHYVKKSDEKKMVKKISSASLSFLTQLVIGAPGTALIRICMQYELLSFEYEALKVAGISNSAENEKIFATLLRATHWPIRRFFNHPQAGLVIRKMKIDGKKNHMERVLEYCVKYQLPAVMDEYAFLLEEDLAPYEEKKGDRAVEFIEKLSESFKISVGKPNYREIHGEKRLSANNKSVRRHIAQAFGDEHSVKDSDEGKDLMRDQIRKAFNSPFWPFVLVTTSIGQEGLDFHRYCGDVVHWNLPYSPVAFEQREGRIQRYMAKAIREAWMHQRSWKDFLPSQSKFKNPWAVALAKLENEEKDKPQDRKGLSPQWIYERNGHFAQIRRWIFCHPLSKEATSYRRMRESVLLYRLSMGQARQDDLVRALSEQPIFKSATAADKRKLIKDLWIDLSAPNAKTKT